MDIEIKRDLILYKAKGQVDTELNSRWHWGFIVCFQLGAEIEELIDSLNEKYPTIHWGIKNVYATI